ncbi:ATP-dependent helicase brm-like [Zingiber officinale]|uniref:ATP-dependent helicase brm-like n=1 Tax=Zingiber officinale TaxID=94328 RepID=UPI001C4C103D|nr:ATP-dependent helicase brm-like [Zingiber officinale]
MDPPPTTYVPGRGLGRRANVPYASAAFRGASQAARQARYANERSAHDIPAPSRHRVGLPSNDSDSDDQPLAQRRRHTTPAVAPDSDPSPVPQSPPTATPTPVLSQANNPPPSNTQVEPPLAQPSTSQLPQGGEAGPATRPSSTIPSEFPQTPSSAPSGSAARPSPPPLGSTAGPSQLTPLTHHCCCTAVPSEMKLLSQQDVPTISLKMKGRLATIWEESLQQMDSLPPPTQMDRFSEVYIKNKLLQDRVTELELQLSDSAQDNHALRAEIKDLTKRNNHLEASLAHVNNKFKALEEEKNQIDVVHQQSMDQQALEHQRAIDQLTQKLRAAETLAQEQDKKLKSQATQLMTQEAELLATRDELAQARAMAEGASTALTIYKDGEQDRCKQSCDLYFCSPEFCIQAG